MHNFVLNYLLSNTTVYERNSVSTSKKSTRLEPRATMSVVEILIGAVFLIGAIAVGPIGYDVAGWSQETAALVILGLLAGVLIAWSVTRYILVAKRLIRPIDTTLNYRGKSKSQARR